MCGRFTFTIQPEDVLTHFHIEQELEGGSPRYNIAPGQQVLSVVHDGENNRAGYLKWGLVPVWAKDPSIGYKMINARSETAHEKPSFKRLMERKRCIIVADSFFEWKEENGRKQPYRIYAPKQSFFSFAGLWDRWRDGDEDLVTCTILTREANPFMESLHHRMPIILPEEQEQWWIQSETRNAKQVHDALRQFSPPELEAYPVHSMVNSAKNDGPGCVEKVSVE
ncbi:hypothetical protein N781_14060 [Pontibacillus halophilus JSM 076056 = DSM 19796]|uniref:Abasic site processing protein n=2 Tax=Pontibacillus TaxID=289201 RepID=A0A0A5IB11_9BACI|nr:SOS response-associated peptidase [Pontibacillus halophilus]KGX92992.1 hypothetical protein N781_14060 [Pontibacillus halophilus JSM 076056 = DSM 19796]